ncbi:expressed unknown protein [Seminavis robusta]|uniref:Uncharacterized protein n=1 Tax=Seminavis robusta TaxID=568900 RepID=A0A9N8DLD0_9STRA|nr:expressed unknown protein [Seminavis robusta]|eukprot:Sro143_g271901.1  (105) ;mRNA; f:8511-8825
MAPGDHDHLRHNLTALLAKLLPYYCPSKRQAWLLNVTTARQRFQRIQHNDNTCKYTIRKHLAPQDERNPNLTAYDEPWTGRLNHSYEGNFEGPFAPSYTSLHVS